MSCYENDKLFLLFAIFKSKKWWKSIVVVTSLECEELYNQYSAIKLK